MRGEIRPVGHRPSIYRAPPKPSAEEDPFVGRTCYAFNPALKPSLDDTRCMHCRHYLTARCPHIDEFLDDVEDLSPE